MNSIILCEGYTDCILVQYFMRKAYGWHDGGRDTLLEKHFKQLRVLTKSNDMIRIAGCGGCDSILSDFDFILDRNNISSGGEGMTLNESIERIVLITDRDEIGTEAEFLAKLKDILKNNNLSWKEDIVNNQWNLFEYTNGRNKKCQLHLLVLVIPFSGTGALETFLLDSISDNNEYDADIIRKCNKFVDSIDPEKKYLKKRRYITKAKFNVYFSIRVAESQFVERQNVLKGVAWENYNKVQTSFEKLKELAE